MGIHVTNAALEAGRLRLTSYRSAKMGDAGSFNQVTANLLGWCDTYLALVLDLADQVINIKDEAPDAPESIDSIADYLEFAARELRAMPRPTDLDLDELRDVLQRGASATEEVEGFVDEAESNTRSMKSQARRASQHIDEAVELVRQAQQ
jgi:hypothetical protein